MRRKEPAPPLRTGAYGYLDEHPLALARWGAPGDYLAARAEALWTQAPVAMWYIRGAMLARALDDGFDWIAWLHGQGAQVVAWTLDASHAHQLDLARTLARAGVDRITTNDAGRRWRGSWANPTQPAPPTPPAAPISRCRCG